MKTVKIKKGLNIPLSGAAEKKIEKISPSPLIAVPLWEFPVFKATLLVENEQRIKAGEPLVRLKDNPQIAVTAPVSGRVREIRRGELRRLMSIVLEQEEEDKKIFKSYSLNEFQNLTAEQVLSQLLQSGLWVLFRERPFDLIANPDKTPHAILVNCFNSYPLGPETGIILSGKEDYLQVALYVLEKLSPNLFLTFAESDSEIFAGFSGCQKVAFSGPHPAGTPGVQIHFLCPVNRQRSVWHLSLQSALKIGKLFLEGKSDLKNIVAFSGPACKNPHYFEVETGTPFNYFIKEEYFSPQFRLIAGSALFGQQINALVAGCGFFTDQITVLAEDSQRHFLGWTVPGLKKFTQKRLTLGRMLGLKKYDFTTNLNGSVRPVVPIGSYEEVFPFRMHPTYLLKALLTENLEEAEKLGCLELAEEDLALCTFVDCGKNDFTSALRTVLNRIKKELL